MFQTEEQRIVIISYCDIPFKCLSPNTMLAATEVTLIANHAYFSEVGKKGVQQWLALHKQSLSEKLTMLHRKVKPFSDKEKPMFKKFKKKKPSKCQIEKALALGIDPYCAYQQDLEAHYASYQQEMDQYMAKIEGKSQNNEALALSLRQVVKENEKLKKNVNDLKAEVRFCQTDQHMFDLMSHHEAIEEEKGFIKVSAKTFKQKTSRTVLSDHDQESKLMQRTMFPPCS